MECLFHHGRSLFIVIGKLCPTRTETALTMFSMLQQNIFFYLSTHLADEIRLYSLECICISKKYKSEVYQILNHIKDMKNSPLNW